eukprot:Sspe_Gene.43239::Locus_21047_Transcript_1_1_Confidence_1.000_Length_2369::g.43239::m.43239/K00624/E2.3.1.7; carnitine O-acetyltransferase
MAAAGTQDARRITLESEKSLPRSSTTVEEDEEERLFEDSVIRRRDRLEQEQSIHGVQHEVRSVFGWTDVGHVPATPQESTKYCDHQKKIPRLPVPDLEHTANLYLKTLEPLLTAEEFDAGEQEVNELLEGPGPALHKKLCEEGAHPTKPSWLEEWWDDSYLCNRDPIAINVNYFFGFEDDTRITHMNQIGRAASLLHGALQFYQRYKHETLDLDFERDLPLCMSQFPRMFGASRIPGEYRDSIITYTNTKPTGVDKHSRTSDYVWVEPRHVVVMVRSRLFAIEVFREVNAQGLVSIQDLELYFAKCVALSASDDSFSSPVTAGGRLANPHVETLTSQNRTQWAKNRERLIILSERNRQTLEAIQQALFVVVLDGMTPQYDEELARVLLHGAGTNRWFDKHNLVVCANGRAGINFEHSVGDGATTLRLADEMYKYSLEHGRSSMDVEASLTESGLGSVYVTELGWNLDAAMEEEIRQATVAFKNQILANETQVLQFKSFGGAFIKSIAKMSPDAFVQIAMQLAYYKLLGRNDATYEAASTRSYLHGRTEVVRSATSEVASFCRSAIEYPLCHRRAGCKVPTQLKLLREAVDAHVAYMKKAKKAQGVDRHLLGLRMIYEEHREEFGFELPSLFKGLAYKKSSHWNLSTSHCGSPSLSLFGFGPVVPDGFGVGYMIKNQSISFTVTAKYSHLSTSAEIFTALLEESLLHLKAIVLTCPEGKHTVVPKSLQFTHPTSGSDDTLLCWLKNSVTRRASSNATLPTKS